MTRVRRIARASFLAFLPLLVGCDNLLTRVQLYNQVEVHVADDAGAPVANVSIVLFTGPRPIGYGASDSAGQYEFTRVPQNAYALTIYNLPPGYSLPPLQPNGLSNSTSNGFVVDQGKTFVVQFLVLRNR